MLLLLLLLQAPLNTPVTEDKFAILTEKGRIPVPILPGKQDDSTLLNPFTPGIKQALLDHFS